jgi:hypothetical protein
MVAMTAPRSRASRSREFERSAVMILAFAVAVVAAATLGCLNLVSWARG